MMHRNMSTLAAASLLLLAHSLWPSHAFTTTTTTTSSERATTTTSKATSTRQTILPSRLQISVLNNPIVTEVEETQTPASTTNKFNEDLTTTFPVGSHVIRLPDRGTRIRLFYPTTEDAAASAAVRKDDGKRSYEYAPYNTDNRSSLSSLVGGSRNFLSECILDAPLASNIIGNAVVSTTTPQELPPILIYSHDVGNNMDSSTFLFKEIASKGTIVAAMEHTDGTAGSYTIKADGSKLNYLPHYMTERQQLARRASELLEAAKYIPKFLVCGNELAGKEVNSTDPTELSNNTVVMLGGHGWGAPAAVMAANGVGPNSTIPLSGIILHDPTLGMGYGMLPPNKSNNRLPTITYTSDEYHKKKRVIYGERTLHIQGSTHTNFVDALRWRKHKFRIVPPGVVDPEKVHNQLADSMARFMKSRGDWSDDVVVANHNLFDVIR